jgi:AraC-like DNA-binding protein
LVLLKADSENYLVRTGNTGSVQEIYYFLTPTKGITPYRYLETVRISQAKHLLENGVEPIETAHQTGFSDQSHFSNFFKEFIGITPKQYQKIFISNASQTEIDKRGDEGSKN